MALRLWALGDKGLAYDEAATALMARASGAEIVQFHWNAAFEHPPLWQLTMRTWTALFGQSEAMLRLLPALAGALAIPLTWYWLRLLWPRAVGLRLLAAGLVATSPALVMYAQEARMYTIVVLLALLSLIVVGGPGGAARLGAGGTVCGHQLADAGLSLLQPAAGRVRGDLSPAAHGAQPGRCAGGWPKCLAQRALVGYRLHRVDRADCLMDALFARVSCHVCRRHREHGQWGVAGGVF